MTYHGRVMNGGVVLDESVELPDGAEVDVEVVLARTSAPDFDSDTGLTLYDSLAPIVGIANDLPPDRSP